MAIFQRRATLHRYVRATSATEATDAGRRGVHLASNIHAPYAAIQSITIDDVYAAEYPHVGEADVWEVSIEVHSVLDTADTLSADEAAHQLITVDENVSDSDVFEHEVVVEQGQEAA